MTYSYIVLEISKTAYEEIRTKLEKAGYNHAIRSESINMNGIVLSRRKCSPHEFVRDPVSADGKWRCGHCNITTD